MAPADGWVAPEGRTPDGRVLAWPGRRFLGYLVDVAIWTIPQMLALIGAVVLFYFSVPEEGSGDDASAAGIVAAVALYRLVFLLAIGKIAVEAEKVSRTGQTWGMRALRLRAVDGRTGGAVPGGGPGPGPPSVAS